MRGWNWMVLSPFAKGRILFMDVKELRSQTGMTQKAFSEYFGMSKRTVEEWECGRRKCSDYIFNLMQYKLEKEGIIKK